jgi:hypothetical protein
MLFTVTVELAESGYFEFCTESLFHVMEFAQIMGNLDVTDEDFEDEALEVEDSIFQYFDDGEEYTYDEDADCYCWYDDEHDAWYWLDEDTGEWLLVEDEVEEEAEEE